MSASFSFGLVHLTPDLGLFPSGMGSQPLLSVGGTLQALTFPVGGGSLALVCASFSLVGGQLAIVGEPVPLRRYPIPLGSEPFASCQCSLASLQRLLAFVEFGCSAFKLVERIGAVISDHRSARRLGRGAGQPARAARPPLGVEPVAPCALIQPFEALTCRTLNT
ncbi:hypothetical protein [Mycobacterium persicum]|uniref:hypothetical protein n=1 Tax=Mycobacterium persicum TaxID=1487726 RepID=UPI001592F424|nr:hypothetical protein [Mycobacterium persicum]